MSKFSKSLNFEHKVYICAIVIFMLVTIFINFIVSNKIEKLENQLQTCTALLKLEKQTSATIITWTGSCYGACDIPTQVENLGVDLLIQWGHSMWK